MIEIIRVEAVKVFWVDGWLVGGSIFVVVLAALG